MQLLFYVIFSLAVSLAYGLTRYQCMTSSAALGAAMDSSDESEVATASMTGSLSCTTKSNAKILVTRIIHGYGNFRGCANPNESCDKEVYTDNTIATSCDGQPSCFVHTFPKWLEKCNIMSDFVHVEYECVFDTSIFDICRETSKSVRDTSIFVVSPNVFQGTTPSSGQVPVCECIVSSRYTDQIMADYIHSDVYSSGNRCSDSYILIESKMFPNQTTVDKVVEVCGRRTVSNQMFRGAVRMTYYNRRNSADDGFLTKLRVPPLDAGAELQVQCGPVRLPGDDQLNNVPPQARGPGYNSFRSGSGGQNSMWQSRLNPIVPQFIPPPFPVHEDIPPPFHGPQIPGWRDPGIPDTRSHVNSWNSNAINRPSPWSNPNSGTQNRSPWDTTNRNSDPNRPWNTRPSSNTPYTNDPSIQLPRDPRRFESKLRTKSSPVANAEQLGITNPTDNSTSSNKVSLGMDPRVSKGNNQKPESHFIPWTNSKKTQRKEFIPWTPVKSEVNAEAHDKIGTFSTDRPTTRRDAKLPEAVQFLGSGHSMKMTDRNSSSSSSLPPSVPTPHPFMTPERGENASPKGKNLAYIIGGIGAALIGLCAVAFFFMCTKRRRSLRAMKKEREGIEDVEQRNLDSVSDDPTYALPSDISFRLPVSSHENEAYVEDIPTPEMDNKSTQHDNVQSNPEVNDADEQRVFTVETQTMTIHSDVLDSNVSIYDNNFDN